MTICFKQALAVLSSLPQMADCPLELGFSVNSSSQESFFFQDISLYSRKRNSNSRDIKAVLTGLCLSQNVGMLGSLRVRNWQIYPLVWRPCWMTHRGGLSFPYDLTWERRKRFLQESYTWRLRWSEGEWPQ